MAGARSGARLSGAGARCGVGQCPVCATHPPPAPHPAVLGTTAQSRGSVIIRGDCGLSALVIVVNLSSYPEIQVSAIFAVFFTFMLNFHRRNIISLSGDII